MSDDEPIRASVYVEYNLRSKLPAEDHVKRNCDCVSPTGDHVLCSSDQCARRFLSSLPEGEQQLCRLAEQSSDSDVSVMLRDAIITRNYRTESEISAMLSKIWYGVLSKGVTAGCLVSCISVCGMAACVAYELNIPTDNIAKSLDEILAQQYSSKFGYWHMIKSSFKKIILNVIPILGYVGIQMLISSM